MEIELILILINLPFSFGVSWFLLFKVNSTLEKLNLSNEKLIVKIDDCPVKER